MTGTSHAGTATVGAIADPEPPPAPVQATAPTPSEPEQPAGGKDRWPYALPLAVLIVGLLVTGILSWLSYNQYKNNERHLLDLRVREVGALLSTSVPGIQTSLASAAELADATNGDVHKFMRFAGPYVGPRPAHEFVSISLWRLGDTARGPIAVVGARPVLTSSPNETRAFFMQIARGTKRNSASLNVVGLRPPVLTRLGYAYAIPGSPTGYVAYGESIVPANRRSRFEKNTAFSDLNYAVFLGPTVDPHSLLVTSLSHLPVQGPQAKLSIAFGSTVLTLIVTPRVPLSGTLPQRLPWIIAIVGALLTLVGTALTIRLVQRRQSAELLAGRLEVAVDENQQLYAEQRTIAQTLQHALLPEELPRLQGAEASARYEPGERGIEIGGDWYDVIPLEGDRLLVVVGDVSGHGLRAAATMASLRYAIHAYAAQNDPPETILAKLSRLLNVKVSGQMATVLCALIDVRGRLITLASAGHLPPLVISDDDGRYLECNVGLPVGVERDAVYTSSTTKVPARSTLLAFTDGLVERRGESLDVGLDRLRLRAAAGVDREQLQDLLSRLVADLRNGPTEDDTAIVGVKWKE